MKQKGIFGRDWHLLALFFILWTKGYLMNISYLVQKRISILFSIPKFANVVAQQHTHTPYTTLIFQLLAESDSLLFDGIKTEHTIIVILSPIIGATYISCIHMRILWSATQCSSNKSWTIGPSIFNDISSYPNFQSDC